MSRAISSDGGGHQKYPSCFFFSIEAAASWSMTRPWRSELRGQQHLLDDRRHACRPRSRWRRSAGSSRACGSAPSSCAGTSPGLQRHALVIDHDQRAVALHHRAHGGEVQRHDRDVLAGRCTARRRARSSSTAGTRGCSRPCACARCTATTAPGAGCFGSQRCGGARNEKMRSLARLFSSSRRAPPKAASKPYLSSACFSACGLHDVGVHLRAVRRTD